MPARLPLLAALALLVATVVVLWLLLGDPGPGPGPPPVQAPAPATPAPEPVPAPAAPPSPTEPAGSRATVVLPPDSPFRSRAADLALVRGQVTAPAWLDWPREVRLELAPQADPEAEPRIAVASREHPVFRFEGVPFGTWRLRLTAPGIQEQVVLVTTAPEVPDVSLVVPLQPATWIRGRVLDAAGRKVADMRVTATFIPPEAHSRPGLPLQGVTDQEGEFALAGIRPGRWQVHAGGPRSPQGEPREVFVSGPEAWVELVVPVTGRATVRVTDIVTGKPLAGVKVQALLVGSRSRGHAEDARTTPDGRAVFPHLPPGEYAFTAWGGGRRRTVVRHRVDADTTAVVAIAMRPLEDGPSQW